MAEQAPSSEPAGLPWPLTGADSLREQLLRAYAEPQRGYHNTLHLQEVCARLAELAAAGTPFQQRPVLLAAWFHDAVYDGRPEAEERSAQWAAEALSALGGSAGSTPAAGEFSLPAEEVAEVVRLVRLTAGHRPATDDANGAALCDADLGVLASEPDRYAGYLAGVRREYAHYTDAEFAAGRAAVVRDLLARDRLFHTVAGEALWEASARRNLAAELNLD